MISVSPNTGCSPDSTTSNSSGSSLGNMGLASFGNDLSMSAFYFLRLGLFNSIIVNIQALWLRA